MGKTLIDKVGDVETYAEYEEDGDRLHIQRVQPDVEPLIDSNKREFNDAPETGKWKGDFHHVAEIPVTLVEAYCTKRGINLNTFWTDQRELKRFLNDPDHRFLRTKPGKV